jgi:putative phosphoribosyl transferase
VGFEVAQRLGARLEVLCVKKLGLPENPEFGLGAIDEEGELWADAETLARLDVDLATWTRIQREGYAQAREKARIYRAGTGALEVRGRSVILVDDGLATGVSAEAALRLLRRKGARAITLAVPVAASRTVERIQREGLCDQVVALHSIQNFQAVSLGYEDFSQTTDEEVVDLLGRVWISLRAGLEGSQERLPGIWRVPTECRGVVIFAHGSGSSRLSARNQAVALELNRRGFATLLFDLLTEVEARAREQVFNIAELAKRLEIATRWASTRPETQGLAIGYFGASTGGAAALVAGSRLPEQVACIVSRGGRPDLARASWPQVRCPTLLIVGGADSQVIALNQEAHLRLANARLEIIPGATHLFEEPGALEQVSELAGDWFAVHLPVQRNLAGPARAA